MPFFQFTDQYYCSVLFVYLLGQKLMIINNSCLLKLLGRYAKMQSPKYEIDALICSISRDLFTWFDQLLNTDTRVERK